MEDAMTKKLRNIAIVITVSLSVLLPVKPAHATVGVFDFTMIKQSLAKVAATVKEVASLYSTVMNTYNMVVALGKSIEGFGIANGAQDLLASTSGALSDLQSALSSVESVSAETGELYNKFDQAIKSNDIATAQTSIASIFSYPEGADINEINAKKEAVIKMKKDVAAMAFSFAAQFQQNTNIEQTLEDAKLAASLATDLNQREQIIEETNRAVAAQRSAALVMNSMRVTLESMEAMTTLMELEGNGTFVAEK